jgi:hypothetical protein
MWGHDAVRIGYADPPYVGQSKKHYGNHPDYDGEVDQAQLIARLESDYDAWVLHLSTPSLRDLLPLTPRDRQVRTLVWVKPFAVWKPNVPVSYAWEPIIVRTLRDKGAPTVRDYISEPIRLGPDEDGARVPGAKPKAVCFWIFDVIGASPTDDLDDIFPGSGAVTRAWQQWCRQPRIPTMETAAVFSGPADQLGMDGAA